MDAKDTLKKMTAWDVDPALSEDELDDLLEKASMMDADENMPSSLSWTPTYDLNSAAAAGWMIKAGRASTLADSKVFENCCEMAKMYGRRQAATVLVR
jgi:hypothetical protein